MCPICGCTASDVKGCFRFPNEHKIEYARVCDNGHRYVTVEVHPTQLADKREMDCAVRRIDRRIAQHRRDLAIAADPRPASVVAAAYDITDARVRQIRASFPDRASSDRFAKIASNLERKSV